MVSRQLREFAKISVDSWPFWRSIPLFLPSLPPRTANGQCLDTVIFPVSACVKGGVTEYVQEQTSATANM